jgi:non-ribosomal peptide synthetase component F
VVDLGGLDDPRAEAEQERLLAAAARRGFDLERGPVIRALLVRRTARLHAAAIVVHHVATDGWSMGVLMGDVEASYRAAVEGRPAPDRRPPIQYADFAAWEAERFAGETAAALEEHWRRALAGAPRVTELPGDRPRPPRQGDRGAERQRTVGPDLTRRLEALGRERSATPFMVLAAVLGLVLHARTGATDLVIGTDVAARTRRETEGLIGFFINQMPVRLDLAGDPTFLELLARVREATLDGFAHQELPFDRLVGLLDLPRDPSRSPLFQIKLVLHNTPMEGLSLPDLRLVPLDLVDTTAQLDLNLRTSIGAAGLWLSFQYATDLYDRSTIDDLLADVERALDLATEDPLHTVSQLAERLAAHERRRREERERELASRDRQRLGSLKRRGARRARTLNIDPEEDRP